MKLHVASHNKKKLRELQRVLDAHNIADVELVPAGDYPDPVEDGASFAENALIKAREGVKQTGLPTVADDSGLTVEALNQMPGILSARWCGHHGDDEANNDLILAQMSEITNRRAAFVSVCALVFPDGREYVSEGRWEGELARERKGENGFGYDPLFIPDDADGRHSAELTAEEKDARSHRGAALEGLVQYLV
ncbi:MAG: RdgB/HAM1 family non-canonical purine NTP pyrophosphatase [Corynebacterium sp.]|nr:RdgB/HAM1 family non-canonical purine NTP pyrophosphatase [Corynebacterium sp.]